MLKAEKEVVIRWDQEEKIVHIYSCLPSEWRRLERAGYKPVRRHFMKGREIARQYLVPLRYFRHGYRAVDAPRRPAPVWLWKPKTSQKKRRKNAVGAAR